MGGKIIHEQEILIQDKKYIVYLKEVPTRIASGGEPISTTIRAFIRTA